MIRRAAFLLVLTAAPLSASFEESEFGGRSVALGGAVTAIADDAFGAASNPAGAAFMTAPEVALHHGELYRGLSDGSDLSRSFGAYVHPLGRSALGGRYDVYRLGDLYKEENFGFLAAHQFGDRLAVGVALRYLRKTVGSDEFTDNAVDPVTGIGFSSEDPVFSGGRTSDAVTGDVGLIFRIGEDWAAGASVKNVNEPDIALKGAADPVARVIRAGLARTARTWTVSAEAERSRFTETENRFHVGAEKWLTRVLALRAGGGAGARDYRRLSAGLGLRVGVVQLDYGFQLPLGTVEDIDGTHQASILFHFGPRPSETAARTPAPEPTPRVVGFENHRPAGYTPPAQKPAETRTARRVPAEPEPLDLLSVSNTRVGATWRLDGAATHNTLAVSRSANLPPSPMARAVLRGTNIGSLGSLAPETGYHLFLNACNGAGCSAWRHLGLVYTRPNDLPKADRFSFRADAHQTFHPGTFHAQENGEELKRFLKHMIARPNLRLVIEAHTDASGDEVGNVVASHEFADDVRDYLVERHGFSPSAVAVMGYGSSRPLADNLTEEGRTANRRVDFAVTAQEPNVDPLLQAQERDFPRRDAPFVR